MPYLTVEEIKNALVIIASKFEGMEFSNLGLFFRNALNFFIGRFTGITWYAFPGMVCVFIYLWHRKRICREEKIVGDSIIAVTLLLIVILIIGRPFNYFGGMDFVCNRYFFILPALFFLPTIKKIKRIEKVALILLPGLLISFQLMRNEMAVKDWESGLWKRTAYILPHAAHTHTFPLKYAPLEIAQVESFPIFPLEISGNINLYALSDLKEIVDNKVFFDTGQEAAIVQKNGADYFKFETEKEEVILKPRMTLRNKSGREHKSFYYFKASRPTRITNYILGH